MYLLRRREAGVKIVFTMRVKQNTENNKKKYRSAFAFNYFFNYSNTLTQEILHYTVFMRTTSNPLRTAKYKSVLKM